MRPFRLSRWPQPLQTEPSGLEGNGSRTYRLASALHGAVFSARITASWSPNEPGSDATVFRFLGEQGNALTRRFSVLDVAAAQDALRRSFGQTSLSNDTKIQLWEARVELGVTQKDRDFAERQATIRQHADSGIAELEAKHAYLVRLRDLFLRDADMAMLWWSDGERDRMLDLATKEKDFAALVALLTGAANGTAQADTIAPLVASFLTGLSPEHHSYLTDQLARVFESYQRPDLAEKMRAPG